MIHCIAIEIGHCRVRPDPERVLTKCFLTSRDTFLGLSTDIVKLLCYCVVPSLFDKVGNTQDRSFFVHTELKPSIFFKETLYWLSVIHALLIS